MAKKPYVAEYYEGAHRVIRGGVPCRVASKPTKNMRAVLSSAKPPRSAVADLVEEA